MGHKGSVCKEPQGLEPIANEDDDDDDIWGANVQGLGASGP
jgi:hypothetical protein